MLLSAATTSLRMPRVLGMVTVRAHPDAFVDAAAEVLGELAVDVLVDRDLALVGMDNEFVFLRARLERDDKDPEGNN